VIYTLYLVTAPDGRQYVGCTSQTIPERWKTHLPYFRGWPLKEHAALGDAIRRWGKKAFVLEHIACAVGAENAGELERQLIIQRGTKAPHGYNIINGGTVRGSRNFAYSKRRAA
jgi:hypothetical protein